MRGQLGLPIQRASAEIEAFLKDLLGEQAAAVLAATLTAAATQKLATASAVPGSRAKAGNNKADLKPKGHELTRQKDEKVGGQHKTKNGNGAGGSHHEIQDTAKALGD